MADIEIVRMLPVLSDDRIIVPGTEPGSNITNISAAAMQLGYGLPKVRTVPLKLALESIVGSTVVVLSNIGSPRQKLFALPPDEIICCPDGHIDWFQILYDLSTEPQDDEDLADIISQCQSNDSWRTLYGS
jgi:hypothetical protein